MMQDLIASIDVGRTMDSGGVAAGGGAGGQAKRAPRDQRARLAAGRYEAGRWIQEGNIALLVLLLMLGVTTAAEPPRRESLHKTLQSTASTREKAVACKQLAVVGNRESVPLLAALLNDNKLSHYARFGLEGIPDSAAAAALRNAASKLSGSHQIGAINSLARLRDGKSVPTMLKLVESEDQELATASLAALGAIATPECSAWLSGQVAAGKTSARLGDATLQCAEMLARDRKKEDSLKVYDLILASKLPTDIRVAAAYSAIRLRGKNDLSTLREQIAAKDDAFFLCAMRAIRELPKTGDLNALLLEQYPPADSDRKAILLVALGDLSERKAQPLMLAAVNADERTLRLASIRALKNVGNGRAVIALLKAASDDDPQIAAAARKTLVGLRGAGVDDQLQSEMKRVEDALRRILVIEVVAARRTKGAAAELWRFADSQDQKLAVAALRALGETLAVDETDKLIKRLTTEKAKAKREALTAAVTSAAARAVDRDAVVLNLKERFAALPAERQGELFSILREVGGPRALRIVTRGAQSKDDAVQDAATRVLGEWLTADVAPHLLQLSKQLKNGKYKVRALRGYVRVIRQFGIPTPERIEMVEKALAAATRNQDRILALQATLRFRTRESMALSIAEMKTPGMKIPAAQIAVVIAEALPESDNDAAAQAMRAVIKAGVDPALEKRAQAVLDRATGE